MRKSPCRLVIYRSIALEYSQSPAIVPTHAYVRAAGRRWRRAHGVQLAQTGRLASSSPSTAVFVHHALTYRLFLARRSSLSSSQNRKPVSTSARTGDGDQILSRPGRFEIDRLDAYVVGRRPPFSSRRIKVVARASPAAPAFDLPSLFSFL